MHRPSTQAMPHVAWFGSVEAGAPREAAKKWPQLLQCLQETRSKGHDHPFVTQHRQRWGTGSHDCSKMYPGSIHGSGARAVPVHVHCRKGWCGTGAKTCPSQPPPASLRGRFTQGTCTGRGGCALCYHGELQNAGGEGGGDRAQPHCNICKLCIALHLPAHRGLV